MQKRKSTFIIIVVLLILFVPLAIGSTYFHFKNKSPIIENPNQEFLHNGKLYFYDNNTLLGTYTCENIDYCDYAISRNSLLSNTLEHKEGTIKKMALIENRYAFLMDTTTATLNNTEIILYDVKEQKELERYKEVKNYGIGINNNRYIVKNKEDKWGVLEFSRTVNVKIPFEYDYIALKDQIDVTTNQLVAKEFAVAHDRTWYLIDENNNRVSETLTETIASYSEDAIITSNGTTMRILDYQGREKIGGNYKYLNFCKNYIAIVDESNIFYLYDMENNKEIGNRYNVENPDDLTFEITEQYIRVMVGEELIENVAIR